MLDKLLNGSWWYVPVVWFAASGLIGGIYLLVK